MRQLPRVVLALALLAGLPAGVAAGGWATVTPDVTSDRATDDVAFTLGFTVLQHGETPAGWERATLHAENLLTGATLDVEVPPGDATGHFSVDLVFPDPGYWAWRVGLQDLMVTTPAQAIAVVGGDGATPPFDATLLLAMLERARSEAMVEADARHGVLLGRLDAATARISELERRLASIEQVTSASR